MSSDSTITRSIEINGVSLYVEEYGYGPPLVLVHGGMSTTSMWFAAGPLLAEHFRIYALDTRGHGRSTNPGGELSYPIVADDTFAAIDALGLERPFIGGYSD
jgi:pimeloyl-ACP methyl ester carboxylesterase